MARKEYELNRRVYERVRKMDHSQMREWAESVYKAGYNAGVNDNKGLTDKEIREALATVKGIGEKKANAIMDAITAKR